MSDSWVGLYSGVPPDPAFSSTGGKGTPIVIDTSTDTPYYAKPGVGPTAFGGSSSPAFPVGSFYFSDNATDPATTLGYGTWSLVSQGYLSLTP